MHTFFETGEQRHPKSGINSAFPLIFNPFSNNMYTMYTMYTSIKVRILMSTEEEVGRGEDGLRNSAPLAGRISGGIQVYRYTCPRGRAFPAPGVRFAPNPATSEQTTQKDSRERRFGVSEDALTNSPRRRANFRGYTGIQVYMPRGRAFPALASVSARRVRRQRRKRACTGNKPARALPDWGLGEIAS